MTKNYYFNGHIQDFLPKMHIYLNLALKYKYTHYYGLDFELHYHSTRFLYAKVSYTPSINDDRIKQLTTNDLHLNKITDAFKYRDMLLDLEELEVINVRFFSHDAVTFQEYLQARFYETYRYIDDYNNYDYLSFKNEFEYIQEDTKMIGSLTLDTGYDSDMSLEEGEIRE